MLFTELHFGFFQNFKVAITRAASKFRRQFLQEFIFIKTYADQK